ncbi:PspC domain-containing protein [Spongiactinospora sp. 9N601]|uniref:PspC domain-containing protein n=1 Tax=Spongiactinospora sp. 9N601 TaxID=3375149 RepID=UPI0037BDF16C
MSDTGNDAREPASDEAREQRHAPDQDTPAAGRSQQHERHEQHDTRSGQGKPDSPGSSKPSDSSDSSDDDGFWNGVARSQEGRILTGVCAGLGRRSGIDPVLFRVAVTALVIASGIGIMLYIAAFLLMRAPDGGPGYVEQWTNRIFDAETVMALLTGVFAVGLMVNLAADGIGPGTLVVGTLFALALLAAHAGGIDILALLRSVPERVAGRRGVRRASAYARPPVYGPPVPYTEPSRPQTSYLWSAASPTAPPRQAPTPPYGPPPQPPRAPEPQDVRDRSMPPHPSAGAPFAPHGPYAPQPYQPFYQPLDPRRRGEYPGGPGGTAYPPVPGQAPQGPPRPPERPRKARKPRRPRTFLGTITVFVSVLVGGIIMAGHSGPGEYVGMHVVGGAMLITVGVGLLVATWFGRGAALVAAGTVMALAVAIAGSGPDMPSSFGARQWRPTDLTAAGRVYQVDVGEGRLDLRQLTFPAGSRTFFTLEVSVGELQVILPPDVRVEVKARARLGDIKIDHSLKGGSNVRFEKTLEPEIKPEGVPATVYLEIKAGLGDVEVRRGA